jgi:2-iminoacetate synthase ThiH
LSAASDGFTASDLAARVRALGQQTLAQYGPTRAAYDLKNFRGQQIVQRIGATRRYEAGPAGLKAITALVVLTQECRVLCHFCKFRLVASASISQPQGEEEGHKSKIGHCLTY